MATFDRPTQLTLFDRPTKPADRAENETAIPAATVEQILAQDRAGWPMATIATLWGLTERQVIDVRYRDMMQRDFGPDDAALDAIFGPTPPMATERTHKATASDETNADGLSVEPMTRCV